MVGGHGRRRVVAYRLGTEAMKPAEKIIVGILALGLAALILNALGIL